MMHNILHTIYNIILYPIRRINVSTNRRNALSLLFGLAICLIYSPGVSAADTQTKIFELRFRTLKVSNADDFYALPVVRLNSNDRIIITFDELGDDYSHLQYRLIHCGADWQPGRLLESEYLEGFNIADIGDYAFSSNTFVHYVNYRIEIPNEDMRPLLSGNYLLQVFPQDDPDETLLQARFQVSEGSMALEGEVSGRTDKGFNTVWQQASLRLHPGGFKLNNPYQDLMIKIKQNNREATSRTLTRPMSVYGEEIVYSHSPELIFPASNEYRRFETVRITGPGMHVDSTRFGDVNYHAYLMQDKGRADSPYIYDQTQRGRFLVRDYNSTDSDLGADYVTVHFTLDFPRLMNADIHLDGEMTSGLPPESTKLRFNESGMVYTLEIPLKQGSYNYQYVVVPREGSMPDPALIEGNKYETLNEYEVEVWYRPPGSRYDRLLNVSRLLARP